MAESICARCLETGEAKKVTKGSFVVEIVLWLLLFIWLPLFLLGAAYTVWRLASKHKACRKCESPELVPLDSERGRQLRGEVLRAREREADLAKSAYYCTSCGSPLTTVAGNCPKCGLINPTYIAPQP
jgi:hypothetical protein